MIDVVGSLSGLILFSPLMLWAARKIRIEMQGDAVFTQIRAGLSGRPFRLYKFRSMTNERNERGELLPDEKRLTSLGKRLRASSIDELPQLWNVIKGDMSLVGPRPLLMEYVPLYSESQRMRLGVKPGITGWAQVNGRNAISWPEKLAFDVWYVEHACLALDFKIIFMTIKKAIAKEGISADGEATMPPFTGER
jgi:lipopolysaccharide/colanic/teichoic acid biosynthesis glycosyltransferase